MNQGVKTVIYPVKDLARAKALFTSLLGAEPSMDQPYYVGWRVGDQDIGLDPNGHRDGMTAYWLVDDIKASMQSLMDAGAQTLENVKDVGGGRLVASLKEPDGNIIGLLQSP